ncbi:outer membrane protein assembly factor BamE [Litoribrevibacter albus]|nr:outer membrane protein assembly factor BamE [Litoribrevibacter albus]
MYQVKMRTILLLISILSTFSLLSGCSSLNVFKLTIQQGNIIEDESLALLKPGMTEKQVQFVLGTPVIKDPFHPNQWDYYHSEKPGYEERTAYSVRVFFEDGKMTHYQKTDITKPAF